ncbi:MAG: GDCCVxC domain-containing (seleno)protein [Vicinamibacterales bacterium]
MTATIICPSCGQPTAEEMPTDRCLFFFDCPSCKVVMRPKPGDCCVFCSYADQPCPLRAAEGRSCCDAHPET